MQNKRYARQNGRLDEQLQFSINQIIVYCSAELLQATQILKAAILETLHFFLVTL